MDYRGNTEMEEFFDYFDVAFPLAFAETEGISKATEIGQAMIDECWISFLASLGVKEDIGFETLSDITGARDSLDGE